MKKQLCRCTALICAILIFCSGCSFSEVLSVIPKLTKPAADPTRYLSEFEGKRKYRTLDEKLQACYGSVYTALTEGINTDDSVTITEDSDPTCGINIRLPHYLSSEEEANRLYYAFLYDNPRFFYIGSIFGIDGYSVNGIPRYNELTLTYSMCAAERTDGLYLLDEAVKQMTADIPSVGDQFSAELLLHDRLADTCTYDNDAAAAGQEQYSNAFNAYGPLVEHKAVCSGYANAMLMLLQHIGIDATLVTGHSPKSGEVHMWNLVTVNGADYHLDVTWDDSAQFIQHNYFNLTTEQISRTHTIDGEQPGVGICTATADQFHTRRGTSLDTYTRQEIAEAIANRIVAGDEQIELMLTDDKYDSALLFLKNGTLTLQMVNSHLAEHHMTMWNYQLFGNAEEGILILRKK